MTQVLSQKQFDAELLDEMAGFVVELFDGQFTRDDLLDGIGEGELGKALFGYTQLGDPNSVLQ